MENIQNDLVDDAQADETKNPNKNIFPGINTMNEIRDKIKSSAEKVNMLFVEMIKEKELELVELQEKYNRDEELGYTRMCNIGAALRDYLDPLRKDRQFCDKVIGHNYVALIHSLCGENCDWQEAANDISKTFYLEELPDYLAHALYKILCNYIIVENLLNAQPYLGIDITFPQYINSIFEEILSFCALLEEYNKKIRGNDVKIRLRDEIDWIFDNKTNPIEQNLRVYLEKNPEIKIKLVGDAEQNNEDKLSLVEQVTLTMDQYYEVLKMTFDFEKIISDIDKNYSIKLMEEMLFLFVTRNKEFDIDYASALIVCHFIMENKLCDYVIKQ